MFVAFSIVYCFLLTLFDCFWLKLIKLVFQLSIYAILALLDLWKVDIDKLLIHIVPFTQGMKVNVALVGLYLYHVSKEE